MAALLLTFKLAGVTTLILMLVGIPLAWWLARASSFLAIFVRTVVTVPLVLPPTVLGFYLLLAMGQHGPIGRITVALGIGLLPFTFWGLVCASVVYSLPFVVQPLQAAFESVEDGLLEAAASLRAGPLDTLFSVVLPLSRPGILAALVLGFTHTVGEFGVVLMIGGNIPDETRVVSVQLYDYVEALEYSKAHELSAMLVAFSFFSLLLMYVLSKRVRRASGGMVRL